MKSIFEQMGGTYRREGDYLLPNLSLPSDAEDYQIGKYGPVAHGHGKGRHTGYASFVGVKYSLPSSASFRS